MTDILVYLTRPKNLSPHPSPLWAQEPETKTQFQTTQEHAVHKINRGCRDGGERIRKWKNYSRNFQAVLVTTGVAIIQGPARLKLHPQRNRFPLGVGGGSPPDPPIKLAGSSHTSRQKECCVFWGPGLFKSSTAASSLCTFAGTWEHVWSVRLEPFQLSSGLRYTHNGSSLLGDT